MIEHDIRHKIKKIKLHTKRVMESSLSGDYLSAFKGSGLEFDQIRPYSLGDDIRFIDWNNSAKMNEIMVKQFIQERERTVILVIDTSLSLNYSSKSELKKDLLAQVAASFAFLADFHKDKVGALFFSDRIEKWFAPSRGKTHVAAVLQTIFSMQSQGKETNVAEALRFLAQLKQRNAIVFFISDMIVDAPEKLLKASCIKYDFIVVRITDPVEEKFPDVGILDLVDQETGERVIIDTSLHRRTTKAVSTFLSARLIEQKKMLERYRIDLLDLQVGVPFITPMIHFFHRRIRRQI